MTIKKSLIVSGMLFLCRFFSLVGMEDLQDEENFETSVKIPHEYLQELENLSQLLKKEANDSVFLKGLVSGSLRLMQGSNFSTKLSDEEVRRAVVATLIYRIKQSDEVAREMLSFLLKNKLILVDEVLIIAVALDVLDGVKIALEHGADSNVPFDFTTLKHFSIKKESDWDNCQPAEEITRPLGFAIKCGYYDIFKYLYGLERVNKDCVYVHLAVNEGGHVLPFSTVKRFLWIEPICS